MSLGLAVSPASEVDSIAPITAQERIETLDILRGFAIFGILIVNWSTDLLWDVDPGSGWTAGFADRVAYWGILFLADEKFWPLFAFLFGLGFAVQMERAEARGRRIAPLYSRRLLVLFLIGAAHFILTDRDIVFMYAILGFLLLPLRRARLTLLPVLALICVLVPWTWNTLLARERHLRLGDPATAEQTRHEQQRERAADHARWARIDHTYAYGSFAEVVAIRASLFREKISSAKSYVRWLGDPFPPFLLGLYVGRRRILHNVAAHLRFIRKVMSWSLGLGLLGSTAFVTVVAFRGAPFGIASGDLPWATAQTLKLAERLGSPSLAIFYACVLTLLCHRPEWKHRLQPLAAVGRMALTNYLMHSVFFVLLFFGYGLGLFGKVGAFGGFMLALPVVAFQGVASNWWLERFRFGPVEWCWRTLTYGKLQPMRILKTTGAPTGASA